MIICVDEPATAADETYWIDGNAALPALLIDEATQAITEALYRIYSVPILHDHDLVAVGVTLGDLFGALNQLADLLATRVDQCANAHPLKVGRLQDELEAFRAMMRLVRHAAEGLRLEARNSFGPAAQSDQSGL